MVAYQTDLEGFFVCEVPCQASPLEPGVWLIPGGATDVPPPEKIPAGKRARFNFDKKVWTLVNLPKNQKPKPVEG